MATGRDAMSGDYAMLGRDERNNRNSNHGVSGNQNASNVQNERKGVEEINVSGCQGANPSLQTNVSADQEENTEMETESCESGAKDEGNNVNGGNPKPGETQENPSRDRSDDVGIFPTNRDTDMDWLRDYITERSVSCSIMTLTNNNSWTRVTYRTSPHIICHSMRSPTPLSELQRHLDFFIQDPAPVKVLITDVSDPESEEEIRRWVNERVPGTYKLLTLCEEEMDSIRHNRHEPGTDTTRDKLKRIREMRDLLSRGSDKEYHIVIQILRHNNSRETISGFVMVGGDEGRNITTNTNHGVSGNQNASDLQHERKEVEKIEVSERQDENPSLQTNVSAKQEENMETESSDSGEKDERNDMNGGNLELGETPKENPNRNRRDDVGIFHTDWDTDASWLEDYISKSCKSCILAPLTNNDSWTHVADTTSPHIICHSMRSPTPLSELERHLDYFIQSPASVKVLITDVSDPESEEEIRRWVNEKVPRTWEILTLYEEEIDSIKPDRNKPRTDTMRDKLKGMRDLLSRGQKSHRVGIFSRSADEHYSWLQTLLRSDGFHQCVQCVRACYISSSEYRKFYQDVSECSFGILYHTKHRGTINVTDVTGSLYDKELEYLSETLRRDNVLVVIDDLDDRSPEMKTRLLQSQSSIGKLAGNLLLFGNEEKSDWEKYLPATRSVNQEKLQEKLRAIKRWLGNTDAQNTTKKKKVTEKNIQKSSSSSSSSVHNAQARTSDPGTQTRERQKSQHETHNPATQAGQTPKDSKAWDEHLGKTNQPKQEEKKSELNNSSKQRKEDAPGWFAQRVGGIRDSFSRKTNPPMYADLRYRVVIFSRSSEEDYSWLQTLLESQRFSHCVRDVRPCYISSSGYRQFYQDVSRCSFGIVYHSKNRGRVNVTDVMDSLYDEELKHLSETLGKKRVVVLIDDLENSSSEEKTRILENQPSIGKLAQNLILINKREKQSGRLTLSPEEMFPSEDLKKNQLYNSQKSQPRY